MVQCIDPGDRDSGGNGVGSKRITNNPKELAPIHRLFQICVRHRQVLHLEKCSDEILHVRIIFRDASDNHHRDFRISRVRFQFAVELSSAITRHLNIQGDHIRFPIPDVL